MCGIAGIHIKQEGFFSPKQVGKLVDTLLLSLEHRGPDASGFFIAGVGGKQVQLSKEPITASAYIWARPTIMVENPRTILLHTRYATKGEPEQNVNNHPVMHGTTFAVHNGHISNDDELFAEHKLSRFGQVDSEIIPALISERGLEHAIDCVEQLEGGFAIGVVDPINYPDELFIAKGKSSPLYFYENHNFLMFASTIEALKDAWGAALGTPPATKNFYYLKEGQALWQKGAEMSEVAKFEVKETYYHNYTGTYSYSGSAQANGGHRVGSNYVTPGGIRTGVLCNCEHTRFWHAGLDYDGGCLGRTNDEICPCLIFTEAVEEAVPPTLTQCDECLDYYSPDNVYYIGYGHYFMCEPCMAGDAPTPPATCDRPQLQLVKGDDGDDEEATFPETELDALASAENRHQYLMFKASEGSEYGDQFCEWLLFKAPIEQLEAHPWMAAMREAVEDLYEAADEELRAWEDEVGAPLFDEAGELVTA